MRTLNRLSALLAVAAIVLLTHTEAFAQTLLFNQPLLLNIAGGSGSTTSTVNVTLQNPSGTPSSLNILSINVSSGSNWLCASSAANVLTVSAGTACPNYATTAELSPGTYSGVITFNGAGATNTAQLNVTLTVSNTGGSTNGLVSNPSTLAFNIAPFSGVTTQTPTITFNGAAEQITAVSWSTVSSQGWLSASTPFTGSLTVSVNTAFLNNITNDSGTVLVTTPVGQVSIPVTISTTGGSTSGLFASPSSLSFNVGFGAGPTSQSFTVMENGSAVPVTGLSETTTSGVNWLQPFISGNTGQVTVQVNPSSPTTLQAGTYNGTVVVNTSFGQATVGIVMNVGSTSSSGLSASVNPVTFTLPAGAGPSTQNVTITLNGAPITLTGISSTTSTGQAWLSASISGFSGGVTVTVNPQVLFAGGTYNGTVFVSTTAGSVSFGVTLVVGSGVTSGLVASPSSANFNIPLIGSGVSPQNLSVTLNGSPEPIQSFTFTLNSGQNWLIVSNTGTGVLSVGVNGASFTTAGTYGATITVITSFGTLTIPVSVTVGSGATSGLAATPNPLTVNVPLGSGVTSQNISVTYNGVAASGTGVSAYTSTGQNWRRASAGGQGSVLVTVNPAVLPTGFTASYSGTVFISTTLGQLSVQVNLNVGSSGSAAGLSASPNPVTFNGVAGGASSSQNVAITFNGSPTTIVSVNSSTTTGQAWLQPSFFASSPGSVTVSVNPSILTGGGTYTGTVTVNTVSGSTTFQVNLIISGGTTTGTSGLAASPNPVSFTQSAVGQTSSQNVVVTFNGVPQAVTSTTFVNNPLINPTFINTQINPDGSVTLTLNNVVQTPGFYQGVITLYTSGGGSIGVPVTLAFGSGGGSGTGLSANPSVLNLSAAVGGSASSQNVSITYNGSPITVSGVSSTTTTGQGWLQPSFTQQVPGAVTVTVNPSVLTQAGTYTGTVSVTTPVGQTSFQVVLALGGGGGSVSGLNASPNPVLFNVPPGGETSSQNVTITFNGAPVTIGGVTVVTSNGQNWLQASNTGFSAVTVTVIPSILTSVGVFSGTVTVSTSSGSMSFQVNVTVGNGTGGGSSLILSSSSLSFSFTAGSTAPAAQTLTVSSNGVPASFTATSSTNTGGAWLSISPTTLLNTPATLTVSVNTASLTPPAGSTSATTYSGAILIAPATGGIAPISVPVSITVTPAPVTTPNVVEIVNFASSVPTALSPGAQRRDPRLEPGAGDAHQIHTGIEWRSVHFAGGDAGHLQRHAGSDRFHVQQPTERHGSLRDRKSDQRGIGGDL